MALEAAAALLFHQQLDPFGHFLTTPDFLPSFLKEELIIHEEVYHENIVLPSYDSCFLENPQFDFHDNNNNYNYNYYGISNDNNDGNYASNNNNNTLDDEVGGLSPMLNDHHHHDHHEGGHPTTTAGVVVRPRRRRARVEKNKEDIENQRMTHIAVERNRRKQMNEYLNVLRSLMPESYVQRGDQASIVGGAINFVKELEQNLQCLSANKHLKANTSSSSSPLPFQEFFKYPQYSNGDRGCDTDDDQMKVVGGGNGGDGGGVAADVEVTVVESHAHLKIRLKRPPKQLSKLVSGLLCLRLTILHLNVNTAADGVVLYSFSLKVEDDSKLSTVDDIAGAVYNLLARIQEDQPPTFNS